MKKLLLTTAAFAFIAAPAFAEHHMEGKGEHADMKGKAHHAMMEKIDTDADGMISKDEHAHFWEKKFEEADADGDGMLSEEEMKAHKKEKMEEMKERREHRMEKRHGEMDEHDMDDMDDMGEHEDE